MWQLSSFSGKPTGQNDVPPVPGDQYVQALCPVEIQLSGVLDSLNTHSCPQGSDTGCAHMATRSSITYSTSSRCQRVNDSEFEQSQIRFPGIAFAARHFEPEDDLDSFHRQRRSRSCSTISGGKFMATSMPTVWKPPRKRS
jgi:hypothetical protein